MPENARDKSGAMCAEDDLIALLKALREYPVETHLV